jgi:hypothetical protein
MPNQLKHLIEFEEWEAEQLIKEYHEHKTKKAEEKRIKVEQEALEKEKLAEIHAKQKKAELEAKRAEAEIERLARNNEPPKPDFSHVQSRSYDTDVKYENIERSSNSAGIGGNIRAIVSMFIMLLIIGTVLDKVVALVPVNTSSPMSGVAANITSGWMTVVALVSVVIVIIIAKLVLNVFKSGGGRYE